MRLHKLTGAFSLIVQIFAHSTARCCTDLGQQTQWRQSRAMEIMERRSVIINAADLPVCLLPVLQTKVLQLFWLSRHVAAFLYFIIISVLIWFSVSTNILTPIFQSGRTHRLRALLIHFHVSRSLLMKILFTFLTPNICKTHQVGVQVHPCRFCVCWLLSRGTSP